MAPKNPFRVGARDPVIARSSSIPRDEPQEVPDSSFIAASGDLYSPDELQQYVGNFTPDDFQAFWPMPPIARTGPVAGSTNGSFLDEDNESGSASPTRPMATADTAPLNANGHLDLMAAFPPAEPTISPFAIGGQSSTYFGTTTDDADMFPFGSSDQAVMNQPFDFSLPPADPSAMTLAFQNYSSTNMGVTQPDNAANMGMAQPDSSTNMGVAQPEEFGQQVVSPPDATSPRGQKRAAAPELLPSAIQTAEPSPAATPSFETPQWGQVAQPQQNLPQLTESIMGTPAIKIPEFTFLGDYGVSIQMSGFKSRVETQMTAIITMSHLPHGVTKLHLPPPTISKPKHRLRPPSIPSPDTLELYVSLVCTTPMEQPELRRRALQKAAQVDHRYLPTLEEVEHETQNGCQVRICQKCMERERKRASRKKEHEMTEQEKLWHRDEPHRIIIFNTFEMTDFRPPSTQPEKDFVGPPQAEIFRQCPGVMQVALPLRLACYCRHQKEKSGFRVIFTFKDWKNNVVAQAMSGSIMITDDHKTSAPSALDNAPVLESQGPAKKRKASAASSAGSSSAASLAGSSSAASSSGSSSAPNAIGDPLLFGKPQTLATNQLAPPTNLPFQSVPGQLTPELSPVFSPNMLSFQQPHDHMAAMTSHMPVANGPPPLNGVTHEMPSWMAPTPSRPDSRENSAMLYSTPVSPQSAGSLSPTRGTLHNGGNMTQHNQMAQTNHFAMGLAPTPVARSPPIIHKVIPPEGELGGGTEVTVLGASFFQGLEVWFGDNKATTTTFWSEASLVCLVPPSTVGGPVPLTLRLLPGAQPPRGMQAPLQSHMGRQQTTYTYKYNNENGSSARSPYSFLNVNLASLPIFNTYIPQPAPLMRKVQEMMSASPGKNADNSTDDSGKTDARWWDLSSYMNSAVAPPAYDDIYPAKDGQVEDLDAKSVLAVARAAAEVETDMKKRHIRAGDEEPSVAHTAVVHEEHKTVTTTKASAGESSSSAIIQPPAILEIGRKHAITKEQQENFLRAREQKLKKLSNDRNLFFIWIPLLLVMVCALLYNYFPSLFPFIFASIRVLIHFLLRMLE